MLQRPSTGNRIVAVAATCSIALVSLCAPSPTSGASPAATQEILLTSASGSRLEQRPNVPFRSGVATGTVVTVHPDRAKQTIDGIGSSFTESSAFVLAHLDPSLRREVMRRLFSEDGADFTLTRTHIGSCDFSVEGKYSYAEVADDVALEAFTIAPDRAGFDPSRYPGLRAADYDLLPMIHEALEIKGQQADSTLRIVASAWTAPPWMKDIGTWWIPASAENGWQGDAGRLRPEYVPVYADYLIAYLDAYAAAGVDVWGLTPVNEPLGNAGHWESMNFTPQSQNEFVNAFLGPRLRSAGHEDVRVLVYDQNRDELEAWADVLLADPRSARNVYGTAVHWYSSTVDVYEDVFDRVKARYPDFALVHTEGCIDNLGVAAPDGIEDPEGFEESGWFGNDAFWWTRSATDWAYTATWAGPGAADHPAYAPVHRYARDVIVGIDHWLNGWIDWNAVLDRDGGPNHVGNMCGAPIMIDTATQEVYYTPVYYVLAQFSRTIRPGDRAVWTTPNREGLDPDALHACATIGDDDVLSVQFLNTTQEPIECALQIGDAYAELVVPANAVQTVRVRIPS